MNFYSKIITGILFMSLIQSVSAQQQLVNKSEESLTSTVQVNVTGVDVKRGGEIVVMIFSKQGFPKQHSDALLSQNNKILSETMTFSFQLPTKEYTEYAVKVWHDENGDGKVSKNWTGIYPKEGLGFSNGQKVTLTGPPKYNKSKLSFNDYKDGVAIAIVYP